jgi:hypothetical protein
VGNKSAKTDRGFELNALGDLKNLATTEGSAGADAEGASQKFFTQLLSGNPTQVAQAVAPTTNAVASQKAAQGRQENAFGTARTGGTNVTDQQTADAAQKATQTAINSVVPGAASTLGTLGTTLLAQSGSAASNLGSLSGRAKIADQERSDQTLDALTKAFAATETGGQLETAFAGI